MTAGRVPDEPSIAHEPDRARSARVGGNTNFEVVKAKEFSGKGVSTNC